MISTRAVVATVPCGTWVRRVVKTRTSWPPAWMLAAWLLFLLLLLPIRLHAQDEAGRGVGDTTATKDSSYKNGIAGEFTPREGSTSSRRSARASTSASTGSSGT